MRMTRKAFKQLHKLRTRSALIAEQNDDDDSREKELCDNTQEEDNGVALELEEMNAQEEENIEIAYSMSRHFRDEERSIPSIYRGWADQTRERDEVAARNRHETAVYLRGGDISEDPYVPTIDQDDDLDYLSGGDPDIYGDGFSLFAPTLSRFWLHSNSRSLYE
jgi:hypothetical protein